MIHCPNKNSSEWKLHKEMTGGDLIAWHNNAGNPMTLNESGDLNPLYADINKTIIEKNKGINKSDKNFSTFVLTAEEQKLAEELKNNCKI